MWRCTNHRIFSYLESDVCYTKSDRAAAIGVIAYDPSFPVGASFPSLNPGTAVCPSRSEHQVHVFNNIRFLSVATREVVAKETCAYCWDQLVQLSLHLSHGMRNCAGRLREKYFGTPR